MRRGEAAGLYWPDLKIRKDQTEIRIQRTLIRPGRTPEFGKPKWNSKRTVTVGAELSRQLLLHRRHQNQLKMSLGDQYDRRFDLVFAKEHLPFAGLPLQVNNIGERLFNKIIEAAEIPKIRIHDLRHTSATLAFEQGLHPKIVQTRLGHSSITTTLDIYSHVTKTIEQQAAEVMGEVFNPVRSETSNY